jgi:hypothetical protein
MSGEIFFADKGPPMKPTRARRSNKAKRADREFRKGGRPRASEDYLVHRIAELFQYVDGLPFSQLEQGAVIEMGNGSRFPVTNEKHLSSTIGELLCGFTPEARPYVLRQIANALEKKRGKSRKTPPDERARIQRAWREAKAKHGDNPTFSDVNHEYRGWHLDRRALQDAGCHVRPDKRGRPHGKRKRKPRAFRRAAS